MDPECHKSQRRNRKNNRTEKELKLAKTDERWNKHLQSVFSSSSNVATFF